MGAPTRAVEPLHSEEGFCCLLFKDANNKCGTCFPNDISKTGTLCATKSNCELCTSTAVWCSLGNKTRRDTVNMVSLDESNNGNFDEFDSNRSMQRAFGYGFIVWVVTPLTVVTSLTSLWLWFSRRSRN